MKTAEQVVRDVLPQGYTPEGVEVEVVDEQTRKLLQQAVPGGDKVLAHLLRYATRDPKTTMQHSLFAQTAESNDEAIVLITSVALLCKTEGSPYRSPDGYGRRLVALSALQVIRRKFHRGYTEIRIPLGKRRVHVPTGLSALWKVHEGYSDEKVKQLARKIAKGLKEGEGERSSNSRRVDEELAPIADLLENILQAHGGVPDEAVLACACGVIASLLLPGKYGRADEKMGEFEALLKRKEPSRKKESDGHGGLGEQVSKESPMGQEKAKRRRKPSGDYAALFRMDPQQGDFVGTNSHAWQQRCSSVRQQGDAVISDSPTSASPRVSRPDQSDQQGDSLVSNSPTHLSTMACVQPHGRNLGEFVLTKEPTDLGVSATLSQSPAQTGSLVPQNVTNSPISPNSGLLGGKEGEFVSSVSISDQYPGDISSDNEARTLIDKGASETTNLLSGETDSPKPYKDGRSLEEIRREAGSLATLLDGKGNDRWFAKLVSCVQHYPSDIRRLAVIDTFYHTYFPDYRKKPRLPGAWFCRACETFALSMRSVPEAVRLWSETGLSYEQIEVELQRGRKSPMNIPLDFEADQGDEPHDQPVATSLIVQREPAVAVVAPSADSVYQARSSSSLETPMSAAQAEALKDEIVQSHTHEGIEARVERAEQGGFVVVTVWEKAAVKHKNAAKWNKYYTEVKEAMQAMALYEEAKRR